MINDESDETELLDIVETSKKSNMTYESFADRLPNVKKIRNKRLYRRLTLIVSIFAIAIAIMLYIISPLSKLGAISVNGNEVTDAQTIIKQSGLVKGDNLWTQFNHRKQYEEKIVSQVPRVKQASIALNGLNTFKITIEEYQVVAYESAEGTYHPILENGKILSESVNAPENELPVFQNFNDQKIVKSLINAYNQLNDTIKKEVSEISYTPSNANKDLVNLHMKDTNIVIVNIAQMVEKMAYYDKVASQMDQHGTIDMEVGIFSYPFTKDSSSEENSENSHTQE